MVESESLEGALAQSALERLEFRIARLRTYLEPPYTFEVPESQEKLAIGDKNYDFQMVRNNNIQNLINDIQAVTSDEFSPLTTKQKEDLQIIVFQLLEITRVPENRTQEQMANIKKALESVIQMLSEIQVSKGADSNSV